MGTQHSMCITYSSTACSGLWWYFRSQHRANHSNTLIHHHHRRCCCWQGKYPTGQGGTCSLGGGDHSTEAVTTTHTLNTKISGDHTHPITGKPVHSQYNDAIISSEKGTICMAQSLGQSAVEKINNYETYNVATSLSACEYKWTPV